MDDEDDPGTVFSLEMGAVVAFETARRLVAADPEASLTLIVSGRRAPSVVLNERVHLLDDDRLLARVAGGVSARNPSERIRYGLRRDSPQLGRTAGGNGRRNRPAYRVDHRSRAGNLGFQ